MSTCPPNCSVDCPPNCPSHHSHSGTATMPDIACHGDPRASARLDWVGMEEVEIPLLWDFGGGRQGVLHARADLFVSLEEPAAKGIHMSRLFLAATERLQNIPLSPALLRDMVAAFVEDQGSIARDAMVRLRFELPLVRDALLSKNNGWRFYPVKLEARLSEDQVRLTASVELTYSSTCPCSAALARQLIQKQFDRDFPEGFDVDRVQLLKWLGSQEGIVATPHSQRSTGHLDLVLADSVEHFDLKGFIDMGEQALHTPVQTAVKREDEQEFARLNGQNPMFCEDAARLLVRALEARADIADYRIKVEHFESLHPHNAVAYAVKGIAGGLVV